MPVPGHRKTHNPYHIVVANKAAAKLFARPDDGGVHLEYGSFLNETARQSLSEITADRAGRSFDRHGSGRHALSDENDARHESARRLAKSVAKAIRNLLQSSEVKEYVVIAAPEFLGLMRHEIELASIAPPLFDIDKDIVDQSIESALGAIERR
jgi:protein required for attachment to host cells